MTANDILNRVAVEVGLDAVQDPMGSQDKAFIQLKILLNVAGEELAIMNDWNILIARHTIDTATDQSGAYDLPSDFLCITNQTAWEHNNRTPVPMISAQDWTALDARNFASSEMYPKYRLQDGLFTIYPQPTPDNYLISFEYKSTGWVLPVSEASGQNYQNFLTSRGAKLFTTNGLEFEVLIAGVTGSPEVVEGADLVVYDRTLITRYLKLKWLKAKGFASDDAQADFDQIFEILAGTNKGSKILVAGRVHTGIPLINPVNNLSDSNYGL